MAFYAEMVRRDSWVVNGVNRIFMFKKIRYEEWELEQEKKRREYQEWYDSLSDEERAEVERRKAEKERRHQMEVRYAMKALLMMPMAIAKMYRHSDYIYNTRKYGEEYNWDGTPNEEYFHRLSLQSKKEQEVIDADAVYVDT